MTKFGLRCIISLTAVFVLLVVFMPSSAKFNLDYRTGGKWKHEDLYAKFDFPIIKGESSEDGQVPLVPYYKYSEEVVSEVLDDLSRGEEDSYDTAIIGMVKKIYGKGIIQPPSRSLVQTFDKQTLFVQKDKRAEKLPSSEVYTVDDACTALRSSLIKKFPEIDIDSLLKVKSVYESLRPNLVYDPRTTQLVAEESGWGTVRTDGYINAGELIVSSGEVVTPDLAVILESYRKEYEAHSGYRSDNSMVVAGNIMVALVIVITLFLAVFLTEPEALKDYRISYICLVFILFSIITFAALKVGDDFVFLVPFTLPILCLRSLFHTKLVLPVFMITLMPLLLYSPLGAVLFAVNVIGGLSTVIFSRRWNRGWKQFVQAAMTGLVLIAAYVGFNLADLAQGGMFRRMSCLFGASMLSVAGYPVTFLLERIFNLVSDTRLIELSDLSGRALRELEKKAPGTFQHSLQVANMAEAAARAIGANPLLLRTGALYHDIGKIKNPLCFVENESLLKKSQEESYHSSKTPAGSAADIIRHVEDGLEIAKACQLPALICDFISTHHGTTLTAYFYNTHLEQGGDPLEEYRFRYQGPRPLTREQAVLMLCDSVEAASKTMTDHSPEAVSSFVDAILTGKLQDGQFAETAISLSDLNKVKEAIKTYLVQVNHERIVYPDNNNQDKNESRRKKN